MSNPNNVYKNMAKNPWKPVVYMVKREVAEAEKQRLDEQGLKTRMTSSYLKREKVRVWSVWTVDA